MCFVWSVQYLSRSLYSLDPPAAVPSIAMVVFILVLVCFIINVRQKSLILSVCARQPAGPR